MREPTLLYTSSDIQAKFQENEHLTNERAFDYFRIFSFTLTLLNGLILIGASLCCMRCVHPFRTLGGQQYSAFCLAWFTRQVSSSEIINNQRLYCSERSLFYEPSLTNLNNVRSIVRTVSGLFCSWSRYLALESSAV